ncbi:interleukin-12 subunit alpha-like [Stegastes partitus]|uniref:Interleukin-12 subunit alpha n=1 Tax=Stegastes partitus TaxID=144197 RepID=A0A9Y4NGB1_9TELE|nr:PREDICTED: interleukin-12 subunit alpha-like [Stegastes partitus]
MTNFHFYFASCALLLILSTSTGLPMRNLSPENDAQCPLLFKGLLLDIKNALKSEDWCSPIMSDTVAIRSKAETVLACAPILAQNFSCIGQRKSSFDELECLRNIMKDLAYYDALIQSYLKSTIRDPKEEAKLLSPTLETIKSLREKCSLKVDEDDDSSEEDAAQMWVDNSFNNRLEMCKMMRGFYVRTITINRAMGYISSGDHK